MFNDSPHSPALPSPASWQAVLDDCLTHREEAVRGYAVAALPAFSRAYVTASPRDDVTEGPADGGGDVTDGEGAGLLDRYLAEVDSDSQDNRRGFALAVGRWGGGGVCGGGGGGGGGGGS